MTALIGLAEILAGEATPGVHRWPPDLAVDLLGPCVVAADWRYAHAVGPDSAEREHAMLAIGAALEFPAYFHGRSLDGLRDCLREISGPTVLLWEGWSRYAGADPVGFRRVCGVLALREAGKPELEVLLHGPDTGHPLLGEIGS